MSNNFFEDLSNSIQTGVDVAVTKTKELASIAKIKTTILQEENALKAKYAKLGKDVFELNPDCDEEIFQEIKALRTKIDSLNVELTEIKEK